jgi:hypothetical protein
MGKSWARQGIQRSVPRCDVERDSVGIGTCLKDLRKH